jgi:hypothetical protein
MVVTLVEEESCKQKRTSTDGSGLEFLC